EQQCHTRPTRADLAALDATAGSAVCRDPAHDAAHFSRGARGGGALRRPHDRGEPCGGPRAALPPPSRRAAPRRDQRHRPRACGRAPSEADLAAARAALGDLAGRPVVLILARRKDQHVLLRSLAALQRPVVVACVGIERDAELRAAEHTVPTRHRVVYVPFTDRPLAFCRLATISALPSRIEGLSISLLETMALGLPVVASDA